MMNKPKGSCYLVQRNTGTIVLRVCIKSKKFERALFKWSAFSNAESMMLPVHGRTDYLDRLNEAMQAIQKAKEILSRSDVFDVASFSKAWYRSEKGVFLSDMLNEYIGSLRLSETTTRIYKGRAKAIINLLGNMNVALLNTSHLKQIDQQFNDMSKSSAKLVHAVLSGALRFAWENGVLQQTPYSQFKSKLKGKPVIRAWVSSEAVELLFSEFQKADEGTEKKAMQIYLMQAYTGARYCDAVRLCTTDFQRGYFIAKKTGKISSLYMSERLALICPKEPNCFSYTTYRNYLTKISERLGFGYVQSHAARRYFACTIYRQTGHNIKVVQEALGHSSITTTERYIMTDSAALRNAVMAHGEM